ncbi:MAG: glycosyltransferase family 2 protein [Anaerolineales bacterium]
MDNPRSVSIIVPCYNEQKTIRMLLASIYQQTYPLEKLEVIIADGLSTDNTLWEINSFIEDFPDLRVSVVDNPQRIIPAGLNQAISAAAGEIIVRLDAHSIPAKDYIQRCVEALDNGFGDNVGGLWEIQPGGETWQARAIASAAAHPLGVGDARYRVGGLPQEVDTVPFGAFERSLIDRVGLFDETLLTNEDYEFNNRIRKAGGVIWFDPAIRSKYVARDSINSLARQYWRYGFWKSRMLRRFPGTFRWRQLPPVFVISFPLLIILGIWFWWARWLLILEILVYSIALLLVGFQQAVKRRDITLIFGVPLAVATMHFSWGTGFIWSMIRN